MKFKTVAEAFNFYKNYTNEQLEQRAQEVKGMIETDPEVDITALNIELTGIKEAKDNNAENAQPTERGANLNVITGMRTAERRSFNAETVADTAEYRSAFFKNMLGQPLNEVERDAFNVAVKAAEKRADAFNTSTDAVAVLPTATLNEVVARARTMGGLMAECRAFNVPTKIAIPVGTPGTRATWHTEGAEVASEKANIASVIFDGYEIIKIFSISAKVRRMSVQAFEAYLVDELTACVMECIADALVNGTGVEQGTGLLTGVTWNETNTVTAEKIMYHNVVETAAKLKRGYAAGAKWAVNNATLYNVFFNMLDDTGLPVFVNDPKDGRVGKILGFEVVVDDNLPDNTIILGNYSKYLGYNMPEGVVIETSRESSFKKGLVDYRAMAIADCKPIVPEAFIKLVKQPA